MNLYLGVGGLVQGTWLRRFAVRAGFLLVCMLLIHGSMCDEERFIMTPAADLFIQVGGDLEMNCTILVDSNSTYRVNAYNLSITFGNKTLPPSLFTYHPAEATIQLNMHNITLEDTGSYLCYYDNSSIDAFRTFKMVNVGVPPGKPENIYCICHNFVNMTCYVDLSKVDNQIPMRWTMQYRKGSDVNVTVTCNYSEDPTKTHVVCGTLSTNYFRINETFNVTVFGKNDPYQFATRQSLHIYTDAAIVKPGPVQSLAYTMMNESEHVEISWALPGLLYCGVDLEYKITVESQGHWDVRTLFQLYRPECNASTAFTPNDSYRFMLDLIPHANYTITVQSKPKDAQGDIYWSDGVTVGFQTQSDVPGSSTILNAGSFYMLDCSTTMACLVLYWKNPPPIDRHGDIVGYQVEIYHHNNHAATEYTSPVTMNLSSSGSDGGHRRMEYLQSRQLLSQDQSQNISGYRVYTKLIPQLKKIEEYVVKMRVATKVGYSPNISEITIPAWSEGAGVRARWVSVELDGDRALVSWQMDEDYCANITEVTYYWCSTEQDNALNTSYAKCKDDFDWFSTTVQGACGNDTHHWVNVSENQSGIRFAVAVATDGKSGGMVWESFRFKNYDAVPGTPLYSIVSDLSNHTLLNVTVQYGDYHISEGGRPDTFTVVYKAVQQKVESPECPLDGHKLTYQVDFLNPVLTVSGLQPGTPYLLCVRSSNSVGMGKSGEPQYIATTAPVLQSASSTVAIAVPLTVGCTIVLIVIIVLGYKFKKKFKKKIVIHNIEINTDLSIQVDRILGQGNDGEHETNESENETNEDSGNGNSPSLSIDEELIHESTPILPCEVGRTSRASSVSALSGYLKVDCNADMLLSDGVDPYEHYCLAQDDPETSESSECFVNIATNQPTCTWTKKVHINHDEPSDQPLGRQEGAMDYVPNHTEKNMLERNVNMIGNAVDSIENGKDTNIPDLQKESETPGTGKPTSGKSDTGSTGLETAPILTHVTPEYVDEKTKNVNKQGTAYIPNGTINNLDFKLPGKEHDSQVIPETNMTEMYSPSTDVPNQSLQPSSNMSKGLCVPKSAKQDTNHHGDKTSPDYIHHPSAESESHPEVLLKEKACVNPDICDTGSVDGENSSVKPSASEYSRVSLADGKNGICVIANETELSNKLSYILNASPKSDKRAIVEDLEFTMNMFEDCNQNIPSVQADDEKQVSKDINDAKVGVTLAENIRSDTPPRAFTVVEPEVSSDDESDISSSVVDDLLENAGACSYQNPDTLSLGQGSMNSDADSISVKSSDAKGDDFEIGQDGENSTLVSEVCSQINALVMPELNSSETAKEFHDKEIQREELEIQKNNEQNDPKNSNRKDLVPFKNGTVTVDTGGSEENIIGNFGSSGQGVNSYIKAAVPNMTGQLEDSGKSVLNTVESDSVILDIQHDGQAFQQNGKDIGDISTIIKGLEGTVSKREHLPENTHI